jgi:hypothetical protein
MTYQTLTVNSANLIKDDEALLALETARDSEWIGMTARGERGNDMSLHVCIDFVW